MQINKNKLEKLLIKKWNEFIDTRELFNYAKELAATHLNINDASITSLRISRFELSESYFVVWLEFNIHKNNEVVNATSELILSNNKFEHIRTILDDL